MSDTDLPNPAPASNSCYIPARDLDCESDSKAVEMKVLIVGAGAIGIPLGYMLMKRDRNEYAFFDLISYLDCAGLCCV